MENSHLDTKQAADEFPDLETARHREAVRRLWCLGPLASADVDAKSLQQRARQTWIPLKVLIDWRQRYLAKGVEGLLPDDWNEVSPDNQAFILEHLKLLGDLAYVDTITWADVVAQAKNKPYTKWTVGRWLSRYRAGGLLALARGADQDRSPGSRRYPPRPIRDPGSLKEKDLDEIERRYERLGELAQKAKQGKVAVQDVEKLAEDIGISARTLWDDIHDLREYGLFGLAPQKRSDYQQHHKISPRMVLLIKGMRLSKRNCTVRDALEMAREKARLLGEVEPSEWQVRAIFDEIPAPVKCLADGKEDEFGDKYRFTHRLVWDPCFMVMAMDHVEPLHLYVKDLRTARYRAKSGETRPYLTLAMDFPTRLVMAFRLSYDKPDRFNVAATFRDCFLPSPLKPFVAGPQQAKVDNGNALNARHVRLLATDLDFELDTCDPHDPQARAILERMNRSLNTELLATLPGYIDPQAHLPHTPAKLTMNELEAKLLEFFIKYNHTEHSETKMAPYQFWLEEYLPQKVDPRKLDVLLMERFPRKVLHEGIKFGNRIYWAADLSTWVDRWVNIRRVPGYRAPDSIEVFDDEVWICTARAFDSPEGRAVTAQEVGQAQRHQRSQARLQIHQARHALETADKEIQALASTPSMPAAAPASASPTTKDGLNKANQGNASPQAVPAKAGASTPPSMKNRENKENQASEPSPPASVETQTPASPPRKESAEHAPAQLPTTRPKRTARAKTSPAPRQNVLDLLTQRRHSQEGGSRQ